MGMQQVQCLSSVAEGQTERSLGVDHNTGVHSLKNTIVLSAHGVKALEVLPHSPCGG